MSKGQHYGEFYRREDGYAIYLLDYIDREDLTAANTANWSFAVQIHSSDKRAYADGPKLTCEEPFDLNECAILTFDPGEEGVFEEVRCTYEFDTEEWTSYKDQPERILLTDKSKGRIIQNGDFEMEIPTRSGYLFNGWVESADGTGDSYRYFSDIVDHFNHKVKQNKTLYAKWDEVPPVAPETVTFNPDTCSVSFTVGDVEAQNYRLSVYYKATEDGEEDRVGSGSYRRDKEHPHVFQQMGTYITNVGYYRFAVSAEINGYATPDTTTSTDWYHFTGAEKPLGEMTNMRWEGGCFCFDWTPSDAEAVEAVGGYEIHAKNLEEGRVQFGSMGSTSNYGQGTHHFDIIFEYRLEEMLEEYFPRQYPHSEWKIWGTIESGNPVHYSSVEFTFTGRFDVNDNYILTLDAGDGIYYNNKRKMYHFVPKNGSLFSDQTSGEREFVSWPRNDTYPLLGWTVARDGSGEVITMDGLNRYQVTADTTLYAKYNTPAPVTVTFDPQGGAVTREYVESFPEYGKHFSLNKNAQGNVEVTGYGNLALPDVAKGEVCRSGYRFIGWNTMSDGKGVSYPSAGNVTFDESTELFACWADGESVPVRDLRLNQSEIRLDLGQQASLSAAPLPENASAYVLHYESSRDTVASVNSSTGEITTHKPGTVVLSAIAINEDGTKIEKKCTVTVEKNQVGQRGDANLDGYVHKDDAETILRHITGVERLTDPKAVRAADYDEKNGITTSDAVFVMLDIKSRS